MCRKAHIICPKGNIIFPQENIMSRDQRDASFLPLGGIMFDFLSKKDRTPPSLPEGTVRRRYSIEGRVQGVGFRYRAYYAAQTLELTGWVENEPDGSVTLEVQGDPAKFVQLFAMIQKSDYIQITDIQEKDLPPEQWERGFSVKGY